MDTGIDHFPEIVRWNVRGHADRNTRGAVEQHVRQTGREHGRPCSVPSKLCSQSTVPCSNSASSTSGKRRQASLP
jgi:hypothetical protein